jgi:long-chain fatty acid transport protein
MYPRLTARSRRYLRASKRGSKASEFLGFRTKHKNENRHHRHNNEEKQMEAIAIKRSLVSTLVAIAVTAPAASYATNGMFMIGYGAKSVAMGGTAIANPLDALSGATNPATVALMGNEFDIGGELFQAHASATLSDLHQDSVASHGQDISFFVIPHMAFSHPLSPNVSFGFSFVGAGGGASRYPVNLYNYANSPTDPNVNKPLGISLNVAQMNPTIAYKFNDTNYFGATLVLSFQQFRAIGLDYFANFTQTGINTTTLTDNGNDYAYGAGIRLGWLGKFMDNRLMVGVAGTSKVYMTKFESYSDLFAESGSMDTPANVGLGLSYKFTPALTGAMDVTYTLYERVKAIGNAPPTTGPGSIYPVDQATNAMGLPDGLGFGWTNQTVIKLGVAYDLSSTMVLRAGWNYGKSPIPSDNGALLVNILAPATTQNHGTLGATYRSSPTSEWSVMYLHAFRYTQTGPAYIGDQAQIGMAQDSLGLTYAMKF